MKRTYLIIGAIILGLIIIGLIGGLYANRKGGLLVKVAPENSEVKIDGGEYKRVENSLYSEVSKGQHKIEVRREGYFDDSQTVDVGGGEQKVISISLKPNPKQPTPTALNTPITKSTTTTPAQTQGGIAQTNQNVVVNQQGSTTKQITNLNSISWQENIYKSLVASNNAILSANYFSNGSWALVVLINPAIQPSQSTKAIVQLSNNTWNQAVAPTEVFDNSVKDIIPADLYNFLYQNNMVISR